MTKDDILQAPGCPHDDWTILGTNRISPLSGTCTKCHAERPLDELLNNWKARFEREIKEALKSNDR